MARQRKKGKRVAGRAERKKKRENREEGRSFQKEAGYRLYALMYRISCLFPVCKNQVFSIMTHDSSENGNVRRLERYMERQQVTPPYHFASLTKGERNQMTHATGGRTAFFSFFFQKPWQMARAEYILMDNAFLPMAYFRIRRRTKVVQLWHGTGTIKKFGQDATKGWLHEQERRINQNITHLIVNSSALVDQYAKAFGVPRERTYPTGLPRTDALLERVRYFQEQEKRKQGGQEAGRGQDEKLETAGLYKCYPELAGKKLLLYAPTFRDTEQDAPKLHVDLDTLCRLLPEEYAVLLRLHPFVAEAYETLSKEKERVSDGNQKEETETSRADCYLVSDYPDLTELMCCSDALITDYSSIIFDYVLLQKPIYFCTDDLEEFSDSGRGFYQPYERFVPGPVTSDTAELAKQIQTDYAGSEEWRLRRERFLQSVYETPDGKATERIYQLLTSEK